jgi:hypothetical protein
MVKVETKVMDQRSKPLSSGSVLVRVFLAETRHAHSLMKDSLAYNALILSLSLVAYVLNSLIVSIDTK